MDKALSLLTDWKTYASAAAVVLSTTLAFNNGAFANDDINQAHQNTLQQITNEVCANIREAGTNADQVALQHHDRGQQTIFTGIKAGDNAFIIEQGEARIAASQNCPRFY